MTHFVHQSLQCRNRNARWWSCHVSTAPNRNSFRTHCHIQILTVEQRSCHDSWCRGTVWFQSNTVNWRFIRLHKLNRVHLRARRWWWCWMLHAHLKQTHRSTFGHSQIIFGKQMFRLGCHVSIQLTKYKSERFYLDWFVATAPVIITLFSSEYRLWSQWRSHTSIKNETETFTFLSLFWILFLRKMKVRIGDRTFQKRRETKNWQI